MVSDFNALLRSVIQFRDEDTPRLVLADWFDENDQLERAEFVRVQVELARGPEGLDCVRVCESHDRAFDCLPAPGVKLPPVGTKATARVLAGVGRSRVWYAVTGSVYAWTHNTIGEAGFSITQCTGAAWRPDLYTREQELFQGSGPKWWDSLPGAYRTTVGNTICIETADGWKYAISRGFISSLTCTAADWFKHADAIYWHPEQKCPKCNGTKLNDIGHSKGPIPCAFCGPDGLRPCPDTAQPLRKVTLTTRPGEITEIVEASERCATSVRIQNRETFEVRSLMNEFHNEGREWGGYIPELLRHDWPGIEFDVPSPYQQFRDELLGEISRGLGIPNP